MAFERNLYITLQYLRTVDEVNKYHWGLFATNDTPPQGALYHATDIGRAPLDLYYETKKVSDPAKSKTMIVCLKIADAPVHSAIDSIAERVPLMNRSKLPSDERQWTCRVWVKETLGYLHRAKILRLPASLDVIEDSCQYTADRWLPLVIATQKGVRRKRAPMVYNDLTWLSERRSVPAPMRIEQDGYHAARQRFYGPKPMAIDSTHATQPRYYGPKPMDIDSTKATQPRYYGPKPMDTGF
ncbi:hypothetical protein F4779DRAFT_593363 [Xylariaceae sp. FL0662B]|nr:hypothetical protein F4779DRAFT_593363 [Xylariaceae sp. FL0662B]